MKTLCTVLMWMSFIWLFIEISVMGWRLKSAWLKYRGDEISREEYDRKTGSVIRRGIRMFLILSIVTALLAGIHDMLI